MKAIVGFSKPKFNLAVFSWMIRLAQGGTKYSHTYISCYDPHAQQDIVFEAAAPGVRRVTKQEFLDKNIIVKEFEICMSSEVFANGIAKAVMLKGTPYGLRAVVGVALKWIFGIGRNPYDDDEKTVFCSEFVAIILKEWGYTIEKDTDLVTPKDVYKLMKKDLSCLPR